MKSTRMIICLLAFLLVLSGCSKRSLPASAAFSVQPASEEAVPEAGSSTAGGNIPEADLTPLTQSSLGQALRSCIREVNSVTVTDAARGELIYQSEDAVLSQSFYDALQIVHEEFDTLDIRPYDFDVRFSTMLGVEKSYGIWVNFTLDNHVIVQGEGGLWDVPLTESNWIRARLSGLV